jgi:pimeloyl-ACP methyl ester carboxylesterase
MHINQSPLACFSSIHAASINHWRYNEKFLTSLGYRVVRLDLLGFGASDKPPPSGSFDYNMELFESVALKVVETVEERGEVKGDKKWIVGGNR